MVTENSLNDNVSVNFCKTHFGHGSNLGRCYLTAEERAEIAGILIFIFLLIYSISYRENSSMIEFFLGKIAAGIDIDVVLDGIRNNVDSLFDPIALTSKRDLRNIMRDFDLIPGRSHASDYVSVSLWIKKMNSLPTNENPIVYHEQSDGHFFLIIGTKFQLEMLKKFGSTAICIDTTHGTNEYDFNLTTLVVVDEKGNGFPAAFCISEQKDANTWNVFFSKLKNEVGVIHTEIFMSDDDPSYYNSWEVIMAPAKHRLICSWHVDQSWRRQIQSKIKGSVEKKSFIYKCLKILHHEPYEEEFYQLLDSFIYMIENDEETEEFAEYFIKYYVHRKEVWAYCYRQHCGFNTNMFLENIHKIFKYYYLKGKTNKRLDKCIDELMRFIRDKTFSRFIKLAKNIPSFKEDLIRRSHVKAKEMDFSQVSKCSLTSWVVPSSSKCDVSYEVTKVRDLCDQENCLLRCTECNICTHIYICGCPDNLLSNNICKFIHSICISQNDYVETNKQVLNFEQENQTVSNNLEPLEPAICKKHKSTIMETVLAQVDSLKGLLTAKKDSFTEEEACNLKKKLDSLLQAANKKTSFSKVKKNTPANKNITKQKRFLKKQKSKDVSVAEGLKVANDCEKKEIKNALLNPAAEILHVQVVNFQSQS